MRLLILLLILIGSAIHAEAGSSLLCGHSLSPCSHAPVQGNFLFNSSTTGAANTAVTVTITGASGTRVHVYRVSAFCSAGTATLTIADGATTKYTSTTGGVGTTEFVFSATAGLTISTGSNAVVTLTACGAANTGTVNVEADQY